jgi:hypothetical protein
MIQKMKRRASPPASPIQSLVIFHLNFAEKCLNGKSLGEDASLEEIGEQILYYHRDRRDDNQNVLDQNQLEDIAEAVQFVGLCTALYGLPTAMGGSNLEDDRTKEVYFGDSTLIFVPLESSEEDLLAVAQISRLYIRGTKCDGGGGNPFAVRESIQRCHALFCLLRGGGILRRLQFNQVSTKQDKKGFPSYPGMQELFELRKAHRKNRNEASRLSQAEQVERARLDEEATRLEREAALLVESLPIHTIRRDLLVHYGEYLGELVVVASRIGCAARCLVEAIPAPIPVPSGQHVVQWVPAAPHPDSTVRMGIAVQKLLDEEQATNLSDDSSILGISAFFNGELLFSHVSRSAGHGISGLSDETAYLLMRYMSSYRSKMNPCSATPGGASSLSSQPPPQQPRLGLKRLTLSFGAIPDKPPASSDDNVNGSVEERQSSIGRFLAPPPSFMLSPLDRSHSFQGRDGTKIWAPLVHLPLLPFSGQTEEGTISMDAYAIMFEIADFSFLIYIHVKMGDPSWGEEEQIGIDSEFNIEDVLEGYPTPLQRPMYRVAFFEELRQSLIEAAGISNAEEGNILDASGETSRSTLSNGFGTWDEPGQDVVVIDRLRHKLILFSGRNQPLTSKGKKSRGQSPQRRRFLGIPIGKIPADDKGASSSGSDLNVSDADWSALGLDCRHRLASHLPLDIILAFDDTINEVRNIREGWAQNSELQNLWSGGKSSHDGCVVELCTCMRQGWIFAYAEYERELFAFFDSSIYVTVADVQNAARDTRNRIFGGLAPHDADRTG